MSETCFGCGCYFSWYTQKLGRCAEEGQTRHIPESSTFNWKLFVKDLKFQMNREHCILAHNEKCFLECSK